MENTSADKKKSPRIVIGLVIGAVLGVPGSYFFQNEMVRAKFGGLGGYLQKLPESLGDKGAWEMGIPQNLLIGMGVLAAVGAVLALVVHEAKK